MKLICTVLLFFGAALVYTQPFVASEGFDRPFQIGESSMVPGISLATQGDTIYAFWRDREGVYQKALGSEGEADLILSQRGVRTVQARTVDNDVALLLVIQNIQTGHTRHLVRWRGEEQVFLETLAPIGVKLSQNEREPAVLYAQTSRSIERLFLWEWNEESKLIHQSRESVERFDLGWDEGYHFSWLEGSDDRQAVGISASNWSAYYKQDAQQPLRLGAASNLGIQFVTRLVNYEGETWVLWPDEETQLRLTNTVTLEEDVVGTGYPLGLSEGFVYWTSGASIRRMSLDTGKKSNIIWSPNVAELSDLVTYRGETHLAWYGGGGGRYPLYSGNNLQPALLTWQDKLAAQFGWSPYGFWNSLFSQALLSLFFAVLGTVLLAPIYWLLAQPLGTRVSADRALGTGITLAWVTLGGLWILSYLRGSASFQVPWFIWLIATSVGTLVAWLGLFRANHEKQAAVLLGASVLTLATFSVLLFLNFQRWIDPWFSGF